TIKGRVEVNWVNNESELRLTVEIPANMLADVYVPVNKSSNESVSEVLNSNKFNLVLIGTTNNYAHYKIESGKYEFIVTH
ncbi:MAG: hypothetical protein DRJ10_02850, partial [Bacteroidetes bacterium]